MLVGCLRSRSPALRLLISALRLARYAVLLHRAGRGLGDQGGGTTISVMTVGGRLVLHDQTLRCDAAIVGRGPGGATVARTLAEAGADVIVLEEGPAAAPPGDGRQV